MCGRRLANVDAGLIMSNCVGIDNIRFNKVGAGRIIRSDYVIISQIRLKKAGAVQPRSVPGRSGQIRSAQAGKGQTK